MPFEQQLLRAVSVQQTNQGWFCVRQCDKHSAGAQPPVGYDLRLVAFVPL